VHILCADRVMCLAREVGSFANRTVFISFSRKMEIFVEIKYTSVRKLHGRPRCSQRGDAIWGRRNFVCAENVCHKGFCSASSFFRDHRIAREKWPPKWCHGQTASTIAAQTGQWSKKEREKAAGEGRRVINRRRDDGGRRCRRCRRRLKIFLPGNKRHTTTGWRTSPLSPRYGRARSRPLDHRDEIIFQPLADCSRSSRLELCPSASRARAKRAEKRSPRVTSV